MAKVTLEISKNVNVIIINLLGVDVVILDKLEQEIHRFERNDYPIDTSVMAVQLTEYNNIPIFEEELGYCKDLPWYQVGVYYIVDQKTKKHYPDRPDLFTPNIISEQPGQIKAYGLIVN